MSRVVVIEDDPAILRGLEDNLRFESHEVHGARDAETGREMIRDLTPDLLLLDVMLPGASGYELVRRLRAEGCQIPILMLTARGQEGDRVMGLDLGADDYVTKPFSVLELMARVRALLRRSEPDRALPERLDFGNVSVDFVRYEVARGGRPLTLARKEFGVLRYLAARPGEVVGRNELLDRVWGYDRHPTTRTVDNHIATLRAKLEDDPSQPRHLITVHGVGYKLQIDEA